MADISKSIMRIKKRNNPTLNIRGILLVRYTRNNLNKDGIEELENVAEVMGTSVFNAKIRECVKVRESQVARMPLEAYFPKCTSAADYNEFVDELLKRMEENK